jgi:hypothetical protein
VAARALSNLKRVVTGPAGIALFFSVYRRQEQLELLVMRLRASARSSVRPSHTKGDFGPRTRSVRAERAPSFFCGASFLAKKKKLRPNYRAHTHKLAAPAAAGESFSRNEREICMGDFDPGLVCAIPPLCRSETGEKRETPTRPKLANDLALFAFRFFSFRFLMICDDGNWPKFMRPLYQCGPKFSSDVCKRAGKMFAKGKQPRLVYGGKSRRT